MLKDINIGCSGYYYPEWKGLFYPAELPSSKWLEYYFNRFDTVEINASFYRFPELKGMKAWHTKTPDNFNFAVKAYKGITHYKKFIGVKEELNRFYDTVQNGLEEKLKCVLFQLPPSLPYSEEKLHQILESLDYNFKNVIEFRHTTWWNPEVYNQLKKNHITFCNISHPTLPEDFVSTSPLCYIRFHGNKELYKTKYPPKELQAWMDKVLDSKTKELYVYFNNTWGMHAVTNALEFIKLAKKPHHE
jgi:uncharacterized protein YecE (DUF72 family)